MVDVTFYLKQDMIRYMLNHILLLQMSTHFVNA